MPRNVRPGRKRGIPPSSHSKRNSALARKRAVIEALLRDPIWADRATAWLADEAGVSWKFADRVREQMGLPRPQAVLSRGRRKRYPATLAQKELAHDR